MARLPPRVLSLQPGLLASVALAFSVRVGGAAQGGELQLFAAYIAPPCKIEYGVFGKPLFGGTEAVPAHPFGARHRFRPCTPAWFPKDSSRPPASSTLAGFPTRADQAPSRPLTPRPASEFLHQTGQAKSGRAEFLHSRWQPFGPHRRTDGALPSNMRTRLHFLRPARARTGSINIGEVSSNGLVLKKELVLVDL